MSERIDKYNAGLELHQKKMREESLQSVKEALEDMRKSGVKVNYSTLSRESGVSRQTLHAAHIQDYLMQQPEFNKSLPQPTAAESEYSVEAFEAQRLENQRLKSQIVSLVEKNERLQAQLRQEKGKNKAAKIKEMDERGAFLMNLDRWSIR
ncbi:DUF6262 family protein [Oscillospiraceae bacterium OttesenSCG-928-F05]|nr:DUF6262 family protein [Oscillospiraceae bacterium OttesenSCG-928-F05]